jgi:parallel beta-helix repeat protein
MRLLMTTVFILSMFIFLVPARAQEPEVISNSYIAEHFYKRPPEIVFDPARYGLDGRSLYVSALKGSDKNPGTEDKPFLTIQKAVDLCQPGDTIYVMQGTYRSAEYANVAVFMNKHGTPDHWIMLRNYPGHNPLIIFKGWDAISIQGSSYIIVSGFIIRGQADKISYDYAYKNRKNTFNPQTMGGGVAVMFVWNDYSKLSDHIIVANNIVYHCPGGGIYSVLADYVTFMNNIACYNTKWSPFANSGFSMYQNQAVDDSREIKMILSGNVSYGNENRIPFIFIGSITDGNGIIIDDTKHTQSWNPYSTPDRYLGKTLIENNICFANGGQGITIFESEFVIVRNNTCYYNAKSLEIVGAELNVVNSNEVKLTGNIGVSTNKDGDKALNIDKAKNMDSSYNLFNGSVKPGPGKKDLVNRDPQFINASPEPGQADFHLRQGSPAVDYLGEGPSSDMDGKKRPNGSAFDLGAYEYYP